MSVKFSEIKNDLMLVLKQKITDCKLQDEEGFTLVEGFVNVPILGEVSSSVIIGGPNIPSIAIVGNSTGRIYSFAVKVLLPDVNL